MPARAKLLLTSDQMNALSRAAFEARLGAKVVKVDRDALSALLRDHSKIVTAFRNELEGYL